MSNHKRYLHPPQQAYHRGLLAETLVKQHYLSEGYTLITTNFRCRSGEIDLIMRQQQLIVFVEVKMRSTRSHGRATEQMTSHKLTKLIRSMHFFLLKNGYNPNHTSYRLDLAAVEGDTIEVIENVTAC